jgi:hypothetical protein
MLNIELERHAYDIDVANEKAYQVITNGIEAVRAVLKPNNITNVLAAAKIYQIQGNKLIQLV